MTDFEEIWKEDLLGFKEVGESFGNLIKSIDDTKVVSIEAGYGRGKTFFRERWAKQLKAQCEVVVEVDALMSDHSGDPVLTFIAALVAALPEADVSKGKELLEKSKKYGGVALRSVLRLGLRQGADEVIGAMTGQVADALGDDKKALQGAAEEFGDGLSKMAGELIAAQVMAERVRTQEIPAQLEALRDALTKDADYKRVVIMVDELDRCHPDYAIAFLEAMKLVFGQDGFVFCLFVNADYLQRVADHRFGKLEEGEQYLDKFVDIRLNLPAKPEALLPAIKSLLDRLPDFKSFGEHSAFSKEYAAELAAKLATQKALSMRQVEKVVDRLDLALRMYSSSPIDLPMLVYLELCRVAGVLPITGQWVSFFPRAKLTPEHGELISKVGDFRERTQSAHRAERELRETAPEFFNLEKESYGIPKPDERDFYDWSKVSHFLAPHYIPSHQAMLEAVHSFEVADATAP